MDSIIQMTLNEALSQRIENYPRVGVGAIVQHEGKVLLGKRKKICGEGSWSFPGGNLEFSEPPEECVKRELFKETELTAKKIFSGPWTNDVIAKDRHYVTLFMIVDEIEGDFSIKGTPVYEEWRWFEWDSLPYPLFLPVQTLITTVGLQRLKNWKQEF